MGCTTLLSGTLGQVRVTLANLVDSNNLLATNVSIGVASTAPTIGSSFGSATFKELTFGGGSHGCTLVNSVPQSSDWVNFSFLSTDTLMVTIDVSGSSLAGVGFSPSPTNGSTWYQSGAFYNNNTGAGWTLTANTYEMVSIETQAAAAGNCADGRCGSLNLTGVGQ
jgi:hypothetical protein